MGEKVAVQKIDEAPVAVEITLEEACRGMSVNKVSPETLGGFYHSQKAAGIVKSTQADFDAAFSKFLKQPA